MSEFYHLQTIGGKNKTYLLQQKKHNLFNNIVI